MLMRKGQLVPHLGIPIDGPMLEATLQARKHDLVPCPLEVAERFIPLPAAAPAIMMERHPRAPGPIVEEADMVT